MVDVTKHSSSIPDYDDISWDTLEKEDREKFALEQAITTALTAKQNVPFYQEHFKRYSEQDIANIKSLEEFACTLPPTTKEHLSSNSSLLFLPEGKITSCMINKGTGGTTGQPVTIWYSAADWNAMAQHIARSIKFDFRNSLNNLKGKTILGLYHGDHVTNDIYRDGLALLNVQLISRVSTKKSPNQNYQFLQEIQPNGILAPPSDPNNLQTKGVTLKELIKLDARNFSQDAYRLNNNNQFQAMLWSSMKLPKDMYLYLKDHLKIPYIQGQYGSTEICPTGATCQHHPLSFHLGYGPNVVNVVHPERDRLVKDDEEGFLLVTKTGGFYNGEKIAPTGTNLINFNAGDYAVLLNTNCLCGRNTPLLTNLKRKNSHHAKAHFGCQTD